MKLKNKKILAILVVLLVFILSSNFFKQLQNDERNDLTAPKLSVRYENIEIDDLLTGVGAHNWTWARTQPWCTQGSGTLADPYIIEHETFSSSGGGVSLRISNSIKYFIIRDCVITNATSPFPGLYLDNVTNGQILNNNIFGNELNGIQLDAASDIIISNNYIYDNTNGAASGIIFSANSVNNSITGNTIYGNTNGVGIIPGSENNLFYNNEFRNNGIHAVDWDSKNEWNSTTIGNYWDDYDGYDNDLDGIGDTPYTGIVGGVGSLDYFPIWNWQGYGNIEINDLLTGVGAHNWTWARTQPWCTQGSGTLADPYIIEHETFSSSGGGVSLRISNSIKYFIIRDCVITESTSGSPGFDLDNVTNGQILNNNIFGNGLDGIRLYTVSDIIISNNEIFDNEDDGIELGDANDIIISNNHIDNNDNGIEFYGNSVNNTITGNNINENEWNGVRLGGSCDNNLIYNNYFEIQGDDHAHDDGSNNEWNSTTIGNYWDNYTGYDNDLDGIGDTPYTAIGGDAESLDYFPIWNWQERIYIDDSLTTNTTNTGNWTWAVSQPWCSGAGTPGSPYLIQNLRINGRNSSDCITIKNSTAHFVIRYSELTNGGSNNNGFYDAGLYLYNVTNGNIYGNNCSSNYWYGIVSDTSADNIFSSNIINSNGDRGIICYNSNSTTISYNNASNNGIYGIYLNGGYHNAITGNEIQHCLRGIRLFSSNDALISGNLVNNTNWAGIYLENSNSTTISRNLLSNSIFESGIYLSESWDNDITENNVSYTEAIGIYLSNSPFNTISRNKVFENYDYGIYLESTSPSYSDDNIITYNNIYNNTAGGLYLENAYENQIYYNEIFGNHEFGIKLEDSMLNYVIGNRIHDNYDLGISSITSSGENLFYENVFVRNRIHAVDNGVNNNWNSATIGNYWDNHTGPDADDNGIVDIPYEIIGSAGSIDYLPIAEDGAPKINIILPNPGDVFAGVAPNFNVTITDDYLDTMWYTIDGGLNNYTFTTNNGIIDQSAWDAMPDGAITLKFYAEDLPGNINSAEVNIIKDTQAPVITIFAPIVSEIFGKTAPSFNVIVTDLTLETIWYSLDGGITTFTITSDTGTINQTVWSDQPNGDVVITFYADDMIGHLTSKKVIVEKKVSSSPISLITTIIVISAISGAAVITTTFGVLRYKKRKRGY